MEQKQVVKPMKKIADVLDILICLLFFIFALYKGGFYKEDSLFVSMIICMLGLVCLSVKIVVNIVDNRKVTKSKLGTLVDICVMSMPIAYFLPILFGKAASMESAIFESIRYINFAIIYFVVRTTSNKKIYLTSIVLIGVILSALGIDELTYRAVEKILNPLSINYLAESGSKISSTLQYANITALFMLIASIIVQDKLVKNLPNLKVTNSFKFRALVVCELFSLTLLQSAIVLTTSRMNAVLMIVSSIFYSIYCLKKGNKKSALMIILMLFAAFCLVTSIDAYLLVNNNFMICFTYVITLVLIITGMIVSTKMKTDNSYSKKRIIIVRPRVLIPIILIGVIAVILVLTLPNSLRVSDTTKEGSMVTRNIYCDIKETMDLDIVFDFHKNNSFVLELYEIDEEFNKKIVVSITEKSVENNTYKEKIKLSSSAESLLFTFTAINSDISIESFKLNNKNITLSYKFLPDTFMFRLKDTFIKDSNNSLRYTYYKDALKLFNKSKLVGIGGEGFKARYQEVQTQPYISSEVHSAPLQILVEAGSVGFIVFITLCVITFIIAYSLYKTKSEEGILYLLMLIVFIVTSLFDLVFSFGIMIYLFAVMIGLVIGEYKNNNILEKDKYELDNKSTLGMLKIATLSISLMILFLVTIYSVNIYRASMIIITEVEDNLDNSYNRVGLLENKVTLDKYNLAYLNSLLTEYDTHIDLLNEIYLQVNGTDEKSVLKGEINNYIAKQKEIADSIIEYEYYNKYAIQEVARCYFKRYLTYAEIFDDNFKNDEIAYVFYIGYAIKLTDRLTEIGKENKLAKQFAINIYSEYLPVIEKHNKIISNDMIEQAIQDMKYKLNLLQRNI